MNISISQKELIQLTHKSDFEFLKKIEGTKGLANKLCTDTKTGISDIEKINNYSERIIRFGRNEFSKPKAKWFIVLFLETFNDATVIFLIVMSILSIAFGITFPEDGSKMWGYVRRVFFKPLSWIEGAGMLIAVVIVNLVSAYNEWKKFRKFSSLKEQDVTNITVKVKRGGAILKIPIKGVLVGDIVNLESGDRVPADGIIIESHDMKVNEFIITGDDELKEKNTDSPFMKSGTFIVEGLGSMIVTVVGKDSYWGQLLTKDTHSDISTPLSEKLDELSKQIGKIGLLCGFLIFLILTVGRIITKIISIHKGGPNWDFTEFGIFIRFITIAITIVVAAVPEGLPLAVTNSLANSLDMMMKEHNFVRNLVACETMGGTTAICCSKSGILTTNEMRVRAGFFGGKEFPYLIPKREDLHPTVLNLITEGIAINTTASIQKTNSSNKKKRWNIIGSSTEGSLLLLCVDDWGEDYSRIRKKYYKNDLIKRVFTFSARRMRMSTIIQVPETQKYRLHCKGAAEIIVLKCTKMAMNDGQFIELSNEKRSYLLKLIESIAMSGKRILALAFRDFEKDVSFEDVNVVEDQLTLLCIVGIEDPIRDEVKSAVTQCINAGINVRMLSGDHMFTAIYFAKQCGIYHDDSDELVMEGPKFRQLSDEEIAAILPKLKVLVRCSPSDKFRLISRMIELGEVVAVTGDSTHDAPTLLKADVGLSLLLSGSQVAHEASDISITDDNFSSIVHGVKWGRSIFESIRKFLQFQLTVNVVALILIIITSIALYIKESKSSLDLPLTAIQLLWINLIMDTFAATALTGEPPTDELLKRGPHGRNDALITGRMWIHIIGQGIYQLTALLLLYFLGDLFFYKNGENNTNTAVFNTFVFCQIFNFFNCRKLSPKEYNIFEGISKSYRFLFIVISTFLIQLVIVELPLLDEYLGLYGTSRVFSRFVQTTGLTLEQWAISVGIGFGCIPFSLLLRQITKLVPDEISSCSCFPRRNERRPEDVYLLQKIESMRF